ncbi:MAG: hypothetical protein ACRYFS_21165 [Janthinobacterium lividum]
MKTQTITMNTEHAAHDLDQDLTRLFDQLGKLGTRASKWDKLHKEMLKFNIESGKLVERQHDLIDMLLIMTEDPEWLVRIKAWHEDDKADYAKRKQDILRGKH